jgi:hypothetical protein
LARPSGKRQGQTVPALLGPFLLNPFACLLEAVTHLASLPQQLPNTLTQVQLLEAASNAAVMEE